MSVSAGIRRPRGRRAAGRAFGLALAALFVLGVSSASADQGAADGGSGDKEGHIPPEAHVCLGCHTVDESGREGADSGPPLWSVVGRRPRVEGVEAPRWTPEALDRWLANPRAMAPDTRSRFPGYADPARRAAVIRFLERLQ